MNIDVKGVWSMNRNPISRLFDLILNSAAYLSGILIFLMILFVSYACFARYLGFTPPVWVLQFTEYALLWVTFLGAGWLLRQGGHIRVDTMIVRFTRKNRWIIDLVDNLFGLCVCAVLFWMGLLNTIDLYNRQIMDFNAVIIPKYIIFWVIPFGGLLLLLQFVRDIVRHLKPPVPHETGDIVDAEVH